MYEPSNSDERYQMDALAQQIESQKQIDLIRCGNKNSLPCFKQKQTNNWAKICQEIEFQLIKPTFELSPVSYVPKRQKNTKIAPKIFCGSRNFLEQKIDVDFRQVRQLEFKSCFKYHQGPKRNPIIDDKEVFHQGLRDIQTNNIIINKTQRYQKTKPLFDTPIYAPQRKIEGGGQFGAGPRFIDDEMEYKEW